MNQATQARQKAPPRNRRNPVINKRLPGAPHRASRFGPRVTQGGWFDLDPAARRKDLCLRSTPAILGVRGEPADAWNALEMNCPSRMLAGAPALSRKRWPWVWSATEQRRPSDAGEVLGDLAMW